ncbi:hypothetical protein K431DRAFT_219500 [Polychaeton citri CBS 116435]|uniref:tRNA-splicing endonuclease subunit Sen15 domain-containing protein n=1 Tax=Polychaeton citri CBS 116435 TaxID=1314669 RepID=A0A9P4QET5_9PEZI|nr:hypothetical protein K431DRAFT_219500 [Polychaeton citri CBS 116435]
MGATRTNGIPKASDLKGFLVSHPAPDHSIHPQHLHDLALQIAHNLHYQHGWTQLSLHYNKRSAESSLVSAQSTATDLPRPVLSGLPPHRLYIHPDEQMALLQQEKDLKDAYGDTTAFSGSKPEREWVIPSHLKEKWSLRRFGECFNGVGVVPPELPSSGSSDSIKLFEEEEIEATQVEGVPTNSEWRKTKRILLATLDDDSTVVYYIVHDGIVKPRQN